MAGCLTAAACGHTDDAAVSCRNVGCARSACLDCAQKGVEAVLLGTDLLGEEVFLPEFEPFTKCNYCGKWECSECVELGGQNGFFCDECFKYSCSDCTRVLMCDCSKALCDSCNAGRISTCLVCNADFCAKHGYSPCAGCKRPVCEGCLEGGGKVIAYCSDDSCFDFLCGACFKAPDRLRECSCCSYRSACARHFKGTACSGCSELTCSACLGACKGCDKDFCGDCRLTCDKCGASSCPACSEDAKDPTRQCAGCEATLCAMCDGGAAPTCDACCDSEYFCWRCRPDAFSMCAVCLTTRCVDCSAEEGGGAGGGSSSGGGGGAGACTLCEASVCAPCAKRTPLTPCPTCPATLCAACIPRHRCSAAKRARTEAGLAAPSLP
jgi:hypothetical protein